MSKENTSIIDINYKYKRNMYIFGSEFVKNNKNKCKMIIDDNEYEIAEQYTNYKYTFKILNIKLKGIDNVTNMSWMFSECSSLSSLPDISKWNTKNATNMNDMFSECPNIIFSKIIN